MSIRKLCYSRPPLQKVCILQGASSISCETDMPTESFRIKSDDGYELLSNAEDTLTDLGDVFHATRSTAGMDDGKGKVVVEELVVVKERCGILANVFITCLQILIMGMLTLSTSLMAFTNDDKSDSNVSSRYHTLRCPWIVSTVCSLPLLSLSLVLCHSSLHGPSRDIQAASLPASSKQLRR